MTAHHSSIVRSSAKPAKSGMDDSNAVRGPKAHGDRILCYNTLHAMSVTPAPSRIFSPESQPIPYLGLPASLC
jgi:hypothetical protein